MATWKSMDQYAPFAQILVRYMWEARPPLNPNQLAVRAGVRRQILSQWLNAPATSELHPDPAAVVKVARAMGMPVADLLIAAGHATEADPLLDCIGAWAYVLQRIESTLSSAYGPEQEGAEQEGSPDESMHNSMLALLREIEAEDIASHQAALSVIRQTGTAQSEDPHTFTIDGQSTGESGVMPPSGKSDLPESTQQTS